MDTQTKLTGLDARALIQLATPHLAGRVMLMPGGSDLVLFVGTTGDEWNCRLGWAQRWVGISDTYPDFWEITIPTRSSSSYSCATGTVMISVDQPKLLVLEDLLAVLDRLGGSK